MKSKKQTTIIVGLIVILTVAVISFAIWKHSRAAAQEQARVTKITNVLAEVRRVNASLPELQSQAKALIMTAMMQRKIPTASTWCETLNASGKLWPATPTNILFAINPQVAGRAYSRTSTIAGDIVVFFETSSPGWNLAGGADLLASKREGAAIAFADGRAMVVSPVEAASLRWSP